MISFNFFSLCILGGDASFLRLSFLYMYIQPQQRSFYPELNEKNPLLQSVTPPFSSLSTMEIPMVMTMESRLSSSQL